MSVKSIIKRGIRYIIKGVPTVNVYPQVSCLAPNELLKGRTALITGGTSGIGYEIAKAYINAGSKVIITGRRQERIDKACRDINDEVVNKGMIRGLVMDNTLTGTFADKLKEAVAGGG
ncbi:SDR family NAD(P)-dependent oxidoreductase [Bacteroides sp. AN502(2024)]|uniref:SDR family NAD(P)-dependent oxidoreductase n=1 Tax=Bacteroides sp. AN502(2024) TaxID=3160599 RepID=UPI0035155E4A